MIVNVILSVAKNSMKDKERDGHCTLMFEIYVFVHVRDTICRIVVKMNLFGVIKNESLYHRLPTPLGCSSVQISKIRETFP